MTKKKANPLPKGAQRGNRNAAKPSHLIGIRVTIRPDQRRRLDLEPNTSAVVRAALDTYFSIHIGGNDAEYDKAFADMAAEPLELDE
jgi:hypothetical protein